MTKCRICGTNLIEFLDLGKQPIANNFIESHLVKEYFYKLQAGFCPTCLSVQVFDTPNKVDVFNDQYAFFTSTSKFIQEHFRKLADGIKPTLIKNSLVIDIGGNDGTFLKNLVGHCKILNIEPSGNVAQIAIENSVQSIVEFFNENTAKQVKSFYGMADYMLTSHVFGHVGDERNSFLLGIKHLLHPNGVWIIEDAYLKNTIDDIAYDQFYNEHIFYSTIAAMQINLDMFGLEIFDIELVDTHGGTIRYYISHKAKKQVQPIVYKLKAIEGLDTIESFLLFNKQVKQSKDDLITLLEQLTASGQDIVGYGASAKSTTILNYCKIGPLLISKLYDTTPIKWGKFSPGAHIPIVPYSTFKQDTPQNAVLFIWNHAKEIYAKEKDFNGRWIIPIGVIH